MAEKKKLSDERILQIVETALNHTSSLEDSELAKERRDALKYYNGTLPAPSSAGNSKFVSQDVFNMVESVRADLRETFSAHTHNVVFTPQGADDVRLARCSTEYCSYTFYRQNDGDRVLNDVIWDGLVNRVGIAQYWWEEGSEETELEIEGTVDQLDIQLTEMGQSGDVKLHEVEEIDPIGQLFKATLTYKFDTSKVCVDSVPPEEFGISADAKTIKKAKLCYRKTPKTRSELLAEGYDEALVKKITFEANSGISSDLERLERVRQTLGDNFNTQEYEEALEEVDVYDCYMLIDINRTGVARLWNIVKAGDVILKKERVTRKPFVAFIPLPIPHAFFGSSFVEKVKPIQNARSVLIRSILDHAVVTNAPRWKVVKGALMNPAELMDQRVGGLVNVTRGDGIEPLMQAPLNPFVFQTIQLLDSNKEDVTGVSSLSQGLSKDAVSKQNSQGLVDQLVSLSKQRQKAMAAQLGMFLQELYLGIYATAIEYDDKERVLAVAGDYVAVTPKQWAERTDVEVVLALSPAEQEREAMKLIEIDQYLKSAAPEFYPNEKRFNTLSRALEKRGFKDIESFILRPEQIKPSQPDPLVMAEVNLKNATAQATVSQAKTNEARLQIEAQTKVGKLKLEDGKAKANHAIQSDNLDLKEREFEHKVEVDTAELALARKAEGDNLKAIAAPNG